MDVAAAQHALHHNSNEFKHKYTLVKSVNVGLTAILLFALEPNSVEHIEVAETSFGTADMGNKGAVSLRFLYTTAGEGGEEVEGVQVERRETEFTFVAAHLAAMEWNLALRNRQWRTIMSSLLFEDPQKILPKSERKPGANSSDFNEVDPLLGDEEDADSVPKDAVEEQLTVLTPELRTRLHNSTIFKPSTHLFVAGDLNYRISIDKPEPGAMFPSLNPESEQHHPSFFVERDQLSQEMAAGRTLHNMKEAPVLFPPTYKYEILPDGDGSHLGKANPDCNTDSDGNRNADLKVWWCFAPHRWPSWCDRILYRNTPVGQKELDVVVYDALPVVKFSDHRAVMMRAKVPLIPPELMAGSTCNAVDNQVTGSKQDTRARIPAPVDREAWEKRQAARKKEITLGFTVLFWGTKEGGFAVLGGASLVVGAWYLGGRIWG